MSQNEAGGSRGRWLLGAGLALAFAAGSWFVMSGGSPTADSTDPKDELPEARGAAIQHAAPPTDLAPPPNAGRPAEPAVPVVEVERVSAPPSESAPPEDDEPEQGDGDGPEEAPFAIPQVESRVEREMSFAEKAGQTHVMITRIDERASRVEARLAEARQAGDTADVHLQEMLLMRLRQRSTQLTQQAAHEEEEAANAQEEEPGEAPPSDAP